jgi:hypothetical protein
VAAYGALPVRTRVLGETRLFAEVYAFGGSDEDALLAAARAFRERYGGPEGDLVQYRWPDERLRALGRSHFEEELLRVESLFVRTLGPGTAALPHGIRAPERFGPEADVLYASCATHWNASAVRDAAFLNWRFAENARHRYVLLALQSGETLRGYAVCRAGPELHPGLGLLMDWLVLPGDDEAAEALLEAALASARSADLAALATRVPEWSPWAEFFQARGFLHHPSEHLLTVQSAAARFDMLWLRDNWWTTLADALCL